MGNQIIQLFRILLDPGTKRRHPDHVRTKPVVKIIPKSAPGANIVYGAIGSGNNPAAESFLLMTADSTENPVLEYL
jgi:hypothetical protein